MLQHKLVNTLLGTLAVLTLGCSGGTKEGNNTPPPPPAPVISSFSASRSTVIVSQLVNLTWNLTSKSPSTLKLTLTPTGAEVFGNSATVAPASTTTYTLTAEDSNGSATKSVTIATTGVQLALPVNDLIYDPLRDRIAASIPSTGGAQGNSITFIVPTSGSMEQSVFVGS